MLESQSILIPKIAYPTYRVGGILAGAQVKEVEIDAKTWPEGRGESDLAWINSPSNPTGRVHSLEELSNVVTFSHNTGTIIASDECYFSFPDTKTPLSILSLLGGDNRNILAVHSLSKRSNLAGYRGAFVVGDSELIARLLEMRKHMGMMVPQPVQLALISALQDEEHVVLQSELYRKRRLRLRNALEAQGFSIDFSEAGLYLWCTRGQVDWQEVGWFADRGIVVTPGSFYGDSGSAHIRIALTATDESIEMASQRLLQG